MDERLEERVARVEGVLEQMDKRLGRVEAEIKELRQEIGAEIRELRAEIRKLDERFYSFMKWIIASLASMWATLMAAILALFFKG